MKRASLEEFCSFLEGEILYSDFRKNIRLNTPYVTRPGIQLTGFFEYFDNDRVQIVGNTESAYLKHLTPQVRENRIRALFKHDIPCVVLTNGVKEYEDFVKIAREEHVILIRSCFNTNLTINKSVAFLEELFAPKMQLHGVLVEVLGVGILLEGESGIGKSEIALELVQRGHRLVSDDLVEVKKINDTTLEGSCPEVLQYFMEIRGVGIIDVKALFGMGAVKDNVDVELVVRLVHWNDKEHYERLGTEYQKEEILGTVLDKLTVPVRPGRNMAVIIETIARNYRVNEMNYNAGKEFCDRIEKYNNENAKKLK
ncbi:HPr(Ser) kinase/phosphatase [Anaerofustis stercorihominis]|uniref:HPr(Ser) kinase/phosphatase n=1 Tax=Anaerofustis stercorihominis TaxID=214853 RepID=UPI00214D0602|nr:HPr(Ser) kinase/phosphatase [Anaerofustis stercorihominis]MCR2032979.1 HPr(Ser) kinase/phosphatase [Anaerofustis stercorihominis]